MLEFIPVCHSSKKKCFVANISENFITKNSSELIKWITIKCTFQVCRGRWKSSFEKPRKCHCENFKAFKINERKDKLVAMEFSKELNNKLPWKLPWENCFWNCLGTFARNSINRFFSTLCTVNWGHTLEPYVRCSNLQKEKKYSRLS